MKYFMFHYACATMKHKQTRGIARLGRSLRDGGFEEMIVEG